MTRPTAARRSPVLLLGVLSVALLIGGGVCGYYGHGILSYLLGVWGGAWATNWLLAVTEFGLRGEDRHG